MCGRYTLAKAADEVARRFGVSLRGTNLQPRYNIAPTQICPVVRLAAGGDRELAMLRWGLVPAWAKDLTTAAKMINARSETVADKPAFRTALQQRRCLVLADGFYEWRREGGEKQPYRICRADGELFAMAGLWERWTKGADGPVESFTILTTAANRTLADLHDRMPVILPDAAAEQRWLEEPARELMAPAADDLLTVFPVSKRVNSVRNDDAGLLEQMTLNPL